MPTALITGITGQDGSYLAELLLEKGYTVHGIIRRASTFNTARIQHLYEDTRTHRMGKLQLHYGDMTDANALVKTLKKVQPDEIYNLAAQSHVKVAVDLAEYTTNVDGIGVLRLLDAIVICGLEKKVKVFQASTAEMFGNADQVPQNENTPFQPSSPYGIAKLFAYWIVVNYRDSHGLFACNGILYNHESPRRGETFVTRKITQCVAKVHLGLIENFQLGNLDCRRDWGHSKDYVEGMWMMLQHDKPDNYVLATGKTHSVKEFVEAAFKAVGREIYWEGEGVHTVGKEKGSNVIRVSVNSNFFRPVETNLQGDPSKAFNVLGWKPKMTFQELVSDMMEADVEYVKRNPCESS